MLYLGLTCFENMIFHENRLPADYSHETLCLI